MYLGHSEYHQSCSIGLLHSNRAGTLEELAAGIKQYFNLTLGTQLLYKQEKQQFKEV